MLFFFILKAKILYLLVNQTTFFSLIKDTLVHLWMDIDRAILSSWLKNPVTMNLTKNYTWDMISFVNSSSKI